MARLLPWLRLVRAGTLFSPGCDVLAGACIGLAAAPPFAGQAGQAGRYERWPVAAAMLASVLIYAAGMVWTDFADRREDARQRPERPLPRGDIAPGAAAIAGAVLLGSALLVSPCRLHHGAIALLVLAYDFVLKRVRVLAAVTMGTLRALNLAVAASTPYVFVPRTGGPTGDWVPPPLSTPLLTAAICYGVYILGVTLLGILEDSPSPRRRHVLLVQSIPPVAALTGITVVQGGLGLAPLLALGPLALFVRRMLRVTAWDQRAIRGSMLWLLLGTMLATALLSLAAGGWLASLGIALCIAPARWIARRISLT